MLPNGWNKKEPYISLIPIKPVVRPVKIILDDSLKQYPCIINTITKLQQLDNNLLKKTIGAFVNDPKYDLIFKVGNCVRTDQACTDANELKTTGKISIIIENTKPTPLELAAMIIHESIHAELYRYVARYEAGVDPNNRTRIFQLFKFYNDKDVKTGDIQHIYMTEKYINPLANALRQIDGNKYPVDYYKSFAWDGLRNWDANKLLSMEMDKKYAEYRTIVLQNTKKACD